MKYPKEVGNFIKITTQSVNDSEVMVKQVLAVDSYLSYPDITVDSCKPLKIHENYSRFVITLIETEVKNNNTRTLTANIPAEDIDYLMSAINIILREYLLKNEVVSEQQSIAFTQKIAMGNLKGFTPGEILLNYPEREQELKRAYEILENNKEQYPGNPAQIEAINEAFLLKDKGKLHGRTEINKPPIVIYDASIRILESIKDMKGNNLIYSLKITYFPDNEYPIEVKIKNTYAPIKKGLNGLIQPVFKKKATETESSIFITMPKFYNIVSRMQRTVTNFEMLHIKELFKLSEENYLINKQNAKRRKEG